VKELERFKEEFDKKLINYYARTKNVITNYIELIDESLQIINQNLHKTQFMSMISKNIMLK
jgi:hypothetical protein